MHLGVVLAGLSEHIDDVAARGRLAARPVVHDGGDLHARAGLQLLPAISVLTKFIHLMDRIFIISQRLEPAGVVLRLRERLTLDIVPAVADLVRLGERYGDVIRHETALHEHPGLISDYMQYSYERSWRPLDYLDYFAFATLAVRLLALH